MKKLTLLILMAMAAITAKAQTVNKDTLAKYSNKDEQLKLFNLIASDIHLTASQQQQFYELSSVYADKAIAVLKTDDASRRTLMKGLRKVGEDYMAKLKVIITPAQFELMKAEREKYHFGKRFLVKS